jgi:hypothetical protein
VRACVCVHLPHVGLVDLAHGEAVKAAASVDDRSDLVATGHILCQETRQTVAAF